MAELRAGVAGAGSFGGHHARKYANLPGVRLVAVFDPHHPNRAEALAGSLGGRGLSELGPFLDAVDVVTVATPAAAHVEVARAALQAGKAVYIEKPLAVTLEDGQALVDLAARRGAVLACGHQERAVFEAMGLLALSERPILIEASRRGAALPRNRDVSCVLDLMIHDLDLALVLSGGEPVAVEGEGGFDQVTAEITFDTGLTANLTAAREEAGRGRTMRLQLPSGLIAIDFLTGAVDNRSAATLVSPDPGSPATRDPLGVSLERFLAAVRGEASRPLATGQDGLRALDLALAVEHALGL